MVSFTALVSAFAAASLVAAAPAAMEKRGYSGQGTLIASSTPVHQCLILIRATLICPTLVHPIATYYFQNGNPGACGDYNPDSALIVAMNHEQYSNGECGKFVKITNTQNGKTVTAKVAGESIEQSTDWKQES